MDNNLPLHGVNTSNITEASFCVFKYVTQNRNKCFNAFELQPEMLKDDASYYKDKLTQLTHVRNSRLSQFKCSATSKSEKVTFPEESIVKVSDSVYEVESQTDSTILYIVDMYEDTYSCPSQNCACIGRLLQTFQSYT